VVKPMSCHPRCMLSHDIINKLAAIISNCDQLEIEIPSPWCLNRTAKIKHLALMVSEILTTRECDSTPAPPKNGQGDVLLS